MDEDRILKHPWLRKPKLWNFRRLVLKGPWSSNSTDFYFFSMMSAQKAQVGSKLYLETYFITIKTSNKTKDDQLLVQGFTTIPRFISYCYVLSCFSPTTYFDAPSSVPQIFRRLCLTSAYEKQEQCISRSGLLILIYCSPCPTCPKSTLTGCAHTFTLLLLYSKIAECCSKTGFRRNNGSF